MNITLNNNLEFIEGESTTIAELMKIKNFTFKMLVVKINGNLIQKEYYTSAKIHEGDNIMILHLISGG